MCSVQWEGKTSRPGVQHAQVGEDVGTITPRASACVEEYTELLKMPVLDEGVP